MPFIMIQSADGTTFQIRSSDPELVGKWIAQTIAALSPDPMYAASAPDIRVRVEPSWWRFSDKPDWPPQANHTFWNSIRMEEGPIAAGRQLVARLTKYLDEREKEGTAYDPE